MAIQEVTALPWARAYKAPSGARPPAPMLTTGYALVWSYVGAAGYTYTARVMERAAVMVVALLGDLLGSALTGGCGSTRSETLEWCGAPLQ